MNEAFTSDRESNEQKKPAFKRLFMLSKIDNLLRKQGYHDEFLHQEGLQHLYNWLMPMPDETFPNVKIILTIL